MRLVDLDPRWVGAGGEGIYESEYHFRLGISKPERHGVGVSFDCPCGCGEPCYAPFDNPLDGGPPTDPNRAMWHRTGDTFETLTLTPSLLRSRDHGGCGWHGFIRDGQIVPA